MPSKKKPKEEPKEVEEDNYAIFAELIDIKIEEKPQKYNYHCITYHTEIIIDGISVSIFVKKEDDGFYSYCITSRIIHLDKNDDEDEDEYANEVILYEKCNFDTLLNLQKDIHEVKKTHRLLEHNLLSPEEVKYAKIQRKCFPISRDKSCCVCYETTLEYTMCNHSICYRCREKCVMNKQFACPICREENLTVFPEQLTLDESLYVHNT